MTNIARIPKTIELPVPREKALRSVNSKVRTRHWRMAIRHLAQLVSLEPLPTAGSCSNFELGDLWLVRSRSGTCRLVRDEQTIARGSLCSHVLVSLFLQGSMRGKTNEHPVEIRRGDIGFFDLAHPGDFEARNASCLSLLVPRWLVHGNVHGLVLRESDMPCKMLSKHLRQLALSLPAVSAKIETLAQSTLSVLQLCVDFAPPPSARGAVDPLRASILAYIEANLDDVALCPEVLASKFGISRTWLYRIFAGNGGIKRYIRDKRLDAAFRDLCANPDRRIIDVAYHRGFSTERQFQRAFLQRFGSPPSAVRDRQKSGSRTFQNTRNA